MGLGNPGPRYASTRHNVGFMVVERLADRHDAGPWLEHGPCLVCALSEPPVLLAKPLTYMNRSGLAVHFLTTSHEIDVDQVLVVVDDIDLPTGRLRLRPSGGPGSHKGLADIVEAVGTSFARLRLGVRGEQPWDDLAEYVTATFPENEQPAVEQMIERSADAVESALEHGLGPTMSIYNRVAEPTQES